LDAGGRGKGKEKKGKSSPFLEPGVNNPKKRVEKEMMRR